VLCFLALVVAIFVRVRWFGVDVYFPAVRVYVKMAKKKCRRRCGPATPRSSSSTTRENSNQDGYVKKRKKNVASPFGPATMRYAITLEKIAK